MTASNQTLNWVLFIILSFIWGSSFILMKEGLEVLSAYQVASLRMLSGGIVLFPLAIKIFLQYNQQQKNYILASGLLGSFFPAYLFCIAETKIDSALAGFLNSLTPILTMIIGGIIFKSVFTRNKWIGVSIGLVGMAMLLLPESSHGLENILFSMLVLVATVCYALNANLVAAKLTDIGPVHIATLAFGMLVPPSLIILIATGFFELPLTEPAYLYSVGSSVVLGVFGTAIASILFYVLLKRAGPLFASMVTYGIPFVALFWGLIAGETIYMMQILGLIVILIGVYLAKR